jgi:predicted Zn-dependent protease
MLSIFRRRMRDRGRDQARPECCRVRPTLEPLEDRVVPYNLSGLAWPSGDISVSYIPDGTDFNNYPSQLFSNLNAVAPTAAWQREFARALQTWAEYTNLNFRFVADDGSPEGVLGICQGNSQFGDIRLGSTVLGANVLGYTHYPDTETTGYTSGGDLALNSNRTYAIGTSPNPDLYSVALHELGHSLGLMHSTAGAVMYGAYAGTLTGLTSDDITGIRAIYGIRQPDTYDTAS